MSRMDRYNDEGWRCPGCGRLNKEGARFCSGCGTPNPSSGYGVRGRYSSYGNVEPEYVAEPPKKKGGVLKVIVIILICLLAAGGIGFGVYKFIDSRGDSSVTEQGNDTTTDEITADDSDDSSQGNTYTEPEDDSGDEGSYYKVGNTYTVVVKEGVVVRSGPGKSYEQLDRSELSSEYYNQSDDKGKKACLKQGAKVECLGMEGNWMKITDGWVCVEYDGETLIE